MAYGNCRVFITDKPKEDIPKVAHEWRYEKPFFMPMTDIMVTRNKEDFSTMTKNGLAGEVRAGTPVVSLLSYEDFGIFEGETGMLVYHPDDVNSPTNAAPLLYVEFNNGEYIPYTGNEKVFSTAGELTLEQVLKMDRQFNSILVFINGDIPEQSMKELATKTRDLSIIGNAHDIANACGQKNMDHVDDNGLKAYLNYASGCMFKGETWDVESMAIPEQSKDDRQYREPDGRDSFGFPIWNS